MRLILLGPPGSGKGTQAKLLGERLHLTQIGTGDILRDAVKRGTPAGKLAEPYVVSGKLVPDSLVNDLVNDRFRSDDRVENFLLDGYPRTLAQAASFDQVLRQQFLDLDAVILLLVSDEEIVYRLSGRTVCPRCKASYHVENKPPRVAGKCDECGETLVLRQDDHEETVRERLRVYHNNTAQLIPHYRSQGLLREVSGLGTIEEVYANILQLLKP